MKWSERKIAGFLARYMFEKKHLVIVPNCSWPGSECDLLVVTPNLRVIDVEIKISRADLKADRDKDKWFHNWDWRRDGPYIRDLRKRREWPRLVWKHYYCLPRAIWKPELLAAMNPASGLLLMDRRPDDSMTIVPERRAKPCRDADRISAEDAIDIARLASLRMWDAYDVAERTIADAARVRALYANAGTAA